MDKYLNIKNMLLGDWQNLLNIKRLGTNNVINPISVADHSWLVAMLVMRICDQIHTEKFDELIKINYQEFTDYKSKMIQVSLIHDIEETIIGDIPRIPDIREEVKILKFSTICHINKLLFDNIDGLNYSIFHENMNEYKLVKYCDFFSLLIECIREIQLGNKNFTILAGKTLYLMEDLVRDCEDYTKDNFMYYIYEYIKINYKDVSTFLNFWDITIKPIAWQTEKI